MKPPNDTGTAGILGQTANWPSCQVLMIHTGHLRNANAPRIN
ncbi:MAG TPA: hypothetical protein VGQ41_21345 [Pyrinomonadaceae bacterium]|nr:hypothetical protein [Pyrinomonadaceae bacterium]